MDTQEHYLSFDTAGLGSQQGYSFATESPDSAQTMSGLAPINLLIGPNNSGKSRFLRALFASKGLPYASSRVTARDLAAVARTLLDSIAHQLGTQRFGYGKMSREGLEGLSRLTWLHPGHQGTLEDARTAVRDAYATLSSHIERQGGGYNHQDGQILHAIKLANQALAGFNSEVGQEPRVYIPILRGLRSPTGDHTDTFATRTQRDYGFELTEGTHSIFTGLTLYKTLQEHLLGDHAKRAVIREYEAFLTRHFFDGEEVTIVPRLEDRNDVVWLKIGKDVDRPIYTLGDGLQSAIIFTFPAFIAQKRVLFFWEEPDVHMHPSMQRKLLEVFSLEDRLKRHQVFLTTHSNHLLDMTTDYSTCSVYLFRRQQGNQAETPRFEIRRVQPQERSILLEIGARSSSVFLTNAAIWVEGITDRLYLREFLRKYLAESPTTPPLLEDTHYSILELGGANLVHFRFEGDGSDITEAINVTRVCADSFVLIDGDNEGKGNRVPTLQAELKDRLCVLKSKEVENLLCPSAIAAAAGKRLGRPVQEGVIRSQEYEGKRDVSLAHYLDKALAAGRFLSGQTLSNKNRFCEDAVRFMRENPSQWHLTEEAKDVCRRVVDFVCKANGIRLTVRATR